MKRYIKSNHNPYPTTTFTVLGWVPGDDMASLNKQFDNWSDALNFAEKQKSFYRRIDINKIVQYDDEIRNHITVAQYKNGREVVHL